MGSCSSNNIDYLANKSYWQPGKPYLDKVEYPAYLDNNPANLDLQSGKAQWGGQYIPNIDQFYKSKSPDNNYWFPPTANVALVPNLDPSHKATSKLAVRQAIAAALDREQISKIGESGYQPAANQTGIVTPTFNKYFDEAALKASGYDKPNTDKAKSLLASAGYTQLPPVEALGHHRHRIHRLGCLAGRHQATAQGRRDRPVRAGHAGPGLRHQALHR